MFQIALSFEKLSTQTGCQYQGQDTLHQRSTVAEHQGTSSRTTESTLRGTATAFQSKCFV